MAAARHSQESARLVDRVASRPMTDMIRSEMVRRQRESAITPDEEPANGPAERIEVDMDPEDTLILLFMCCHPPLGKSSAIAFTLHAPGGSPLPKRQRIYGRLRRPWRSGSAAQNRASWHRVFPSACQLRGPKRAPARGSRRPVSDSNERYARSIGTQLQWIWQRKQWEMGEITRPKDRGHSPLSISYCPIHNQTWLRSSA